MNSANQIQNNPNSTRRGIRWFAVVAGGSFVLLLILMGIGCKPATKHPATEVATPESALKELLAKAETGDAEAQFKLGIIYESGKGVPQNFAESIKWTRKAAEQGFAEAQTRLGKCYGEGRGVPKDIKEETKWYRRAAEQGDADGQTMLAMRVNFGLADKDVVEAYKWACIAAAHAGGENGKFITEFRDKLLKEITPEEVAEAQRKAASFVPKKEAKPR